MGYHETYEFFAIDRPLTASEMKALRALSTRATITPTRFYNFYDWGGLKGDPRDMLRRYFDLVIYTGEGGARCGMLRVPADRVDSRRWRAYVPEQRGPQPPARCASFVTRGDATILTLVPLEDAGLPGLPGYSDEEEPYNEASWAVPLAVLRAELLAGDARGLYLMWLASVQGGERRPAAREPPRPSGLDRLTGMLHALAEFLRLDDDLLAVALVSPVPAAGRTAGALLEAARERAG
jgi:hypothetical protein